MTEAAQESAPKPKRKSRAKDNSASIMKELSGLMNERTALLTKMRAKKLEVAAKQAEYAELESALNQLGSEISWRANIFGLAAQPVSGIAPPPQPPAYAPAGGPQPVPGVIFAQPQQPPVNTSGINRGFADLGSLV